MNPTEKNELNTFAALGLSATTLEAIIQKGFEEPTEIQKKVIPLLLKNEVDVIGQAQTGTGKTAVFGLCLVEKLTAMAGYTQALILVPTRELAIQVAEEINSLKGKKQLSIVPIYGGQSMTEQLRRLKKGVDIVVGTPGRVLDHLRRSSLKLDQLSFIVLDEADEMLNMGFIDDVEDIMKKTPSKKRVLLFSATMPKRILQITEKYMGKKELVSVQNTQMTTQLTNQIYFEVAAADRFEALCRIIDVEPEFYGIIFCRTKVDVDTVAAHLADRGYQTDALHGDISQPLREKMLRKFRDKQTNVLVATDVAARGIDVNNLTHVINFSLPQQAEAYVHRIGRTGRAGKQGTAITFITPDEYRKLVFIQKITNTKISKQTLPQAAEVIKVKVQRIKDDLQSIIQESDYKEYVKLAGDLLQEHDAAVVMAGLLKYCFQEELEEQSYPQIRDVSINKNLNKKGTTRLFVALGKKDRITPPKLAGMIVEKADVPNRNIRNIEIFENFSFITVPFEDAEVILDVFNKNLKGAKPMITRAKKEQQTVRG